jgi:bifunctional UDP-N-acetylglucosamine pyrophosphorylase/glucosamine-1-phosphate N-acetyltransferase
MSTTALILAAGEGTRMKSSLPKVAHRILGTPMVRLVVDAARAAGCDRIVAVTGHEAEAVEALIEGVECARQDRQLGTGHAVMCARSALEGVTGSLVVLSGDTPLMTAETISGLVAMRESSGSAVTVLTAHVADPSGYGRIVRDRDGSIAAIVEDKDCTPEQRRIDEVNTGTYCFDIAVLFAHLDRLTTANSQGEYYLTDMIAVFEQEGMGVSASLVDNPFETMGVNSRVQLAEASKVLQSRINKAWMLEGVTMTDPELVWVGPDVELARDVELLPMTTLMGATKIGERSVVGPNTRIFDSFVGKDCVIDSSVLKGAQVEDGSTVGPVAYLRPGAVLEKGSKAGACVEIKNSVVGEGSKVPHLSYIGDATIGRGVNVGAGTITCNYDGRHKHRTEIEDGAFIGSDTMLVAPVKVGKNAITGAGSAISQDVPEGSLAIERSEQRNIEGWALRKRAEADDGE